MYTNNDIRLIVEAINNLRQPVDIFKDYFFPIFSAILSSALALFVAYISLHYQERIANEKRKAQEVNKWFFMANEAWQNLISIKTNYSGKLNSNPISRAVTIPPILSLNDNNIKIEESYRLAFLAPNQKDYDRNNVIKWSNISLITIMISNYNSVLAIWRHRNEIMIDVRRDVLNQIKEGYINMDITTLKSKIGDQKLMQLIDLTEKAIIYTDDLIVELFDFLVNFPTYAKSQINYKSIKKYEKIMMMPDTQEEAILRIMQKSPDADYSNVVDLYGMNLEMLKALYSRLYK